MPDFVAPQLCISVDRPRSGPGWCHEIKFDGYRVQLRVEDGEATLKTRKGLDWTGKFKTIKGSGTYTCKSTPKGGQCDWEAEAEM